MRDWNAVITVREGGFLSAIRLLETLGTVRKTEFFNTLVMRADDPFRLLAHLQEELGANRQIESWISRFMPMQQRFSFQSAEEFEVLSQEAVRDWLPRIANARFHVRMHRRGFKGRLSSMEEERFLDGFLLHNLAMAGTPGEVSFEDPDAIIAIETVGVQAGASLFDREELRRYTLLHLT